MKNWPVQDARARFSELLDLCLREGPQMVTKRGAAAAVLVPLAEWLRLQQSARPTLKELLLADEARADLVLPSHVGSVIGVQAHCLSEVTLVSFSIPTSYLSCGVRVRTALSWLGCGT